MYENNCETDKADKIKKLKDKIRAQEREITKHRAEKQAAVSACVAAKSEERVKRLKNRIRLAEEAMDDVEREDQEELRGGRRNIIRYRIRYGRLT